MLSTVTVGIIMRILLAAILGGIVGIERGSGDRPAGLRTHVLVCMGSALIMVVSIYAFDPQLYPRDPGRIAAQVVSGIGFLGAGTILHEGLTVRGLTTAASLWMVAAIGLAAGAGMTLIAVVATVVTLITLVTFHGWEKRFGVVRSKAEKRYLRVTLKNDEDAVATLLNFLADNKIKVRTINIQNDKVKNKIIIDLYLKIAQETNPNIIISNLGMLDYVLKVENVV